MAPWTHAQDIRVCVNFRKLGQCSKPEYIADGEQKKKSKWSEEWILSFVTPENVILNAHAGHL